MLKKTLVLAALSAAIVSGTAQAAAARDYISIVGSSTVYPFATVVAEHLAKTGSLDESMQLYQRAVQIDQGQAQARRVAVPGDVRFGDREGETLHPGGRHLASLQEIWVAPRPPTSRRGRMKAGHAQWRGTAKGVGWRRQDSKAAQFPPESGCTHRLRR